MTDMRKIAIIVMSMLGACGWQEAMAFTEKTISVTVTQAPAPGGDAAAAPSTKTITVGELSLFTLRRTSLVVGSTPDIVFVAPYYYAAPVALCNPDGSPFTVNGARATAVAYFGIAYESGAWKDISGIPVDGSGLRQWANGTYALVSDGVGAPRRLQALLGGANAQTIAYGTTPFGAGNVPQLYTLSQFDVDVLTNTGLFFSGTGDTPGSLIEIATNGYKDLAPAVGAAPAVWGNNILEKISVPAGDPALGSTVQVEVPAIGGAPSTYAIPKSMVYQVMKDADGVVRQYYLNTLTGDQVVAGTSRAQQPFQCFVPVAVDMQLADYYIKVPNQTAGGPALFVALASSQANKFTTTLPAGASASLGFAVSRANPATSSLAQFTLNGPACLEVEQGETTTRQLYCLSGASSSFSYALPTETMTRYLSLVGSTAKADIKQKEAFYQQMQEQYVAKCFVGAATEQFFSGQLLFYMRSLDQLGSVTQAQIKANPACLVSFWRNALCGAGSTKVKAVLQDGPTKELEKEWSNAQNCGGLLQVQFTTANASLTYDGVMIFPAAVASGVVPYYRTDLLAPVAQLWFTPSAGIVNQLALTFDATTITGATFASDAQVAALATSPGNPVPAFMAKANVFWGLVPASHSSGGLSDAQKTQIGMGTGMGVLGLFGAYQWYRRRQENKY